MMENNIYNKAYSYEELAVKLLNEKYQDSFEIEEVQSHSYFKGYYTVLAYQVDNADCLFRAYVNSDGKAISDNYVTKIVCAKLADKVAQNLDALGGIYSIFAEAKIEPKMLDHIDLTLDEFLDIYPKNQFTIYINYCPEEKDADEIFKSLENALMDISAINGAIRFFIMDETMLSKIQDYLETRDRCYDDYKDMTEEYLVAVIPFEAGKIKCTKEEFREMLENRL